MAEIVAGPAIARDLPNIRMQGRTLFIVGFLVLFLELACIRWFTAYVVFLQFFTNVALLAAGPLVPLDVFLTGGLAWRYGAPCVLALGPMFFAGVVFSRSFRDAPQPDLALGSNIAGSVVGGLAKSMSMLLGFQHLLLVALLLYVLSMWSPRARMAVAVP
jgi:hypothetical protein